MHGKRMPDCHNPCCAVSGCLLCREVWIEVEWWGGGLGVVVIRWRWRGIRTRSAGAVQVRVYISGEIEIKIFLHSLRSLSLADFFSLSWPQQPFKLKRLSPVYTNISLCFSWFIIHFRSIHTISYYLTNYLISPKPPCYYTHIHINECLLLLFIYLYKTPAALQRVSLFPVPPTDPSCPFCYLYIFLYISTEPELYRMSL